MNRIQWSGEKGKLEECLKINVHVMVKVHISISGDRTVWVHYEDMEKQLCNIDRDAAGQQGNTGNPIASSKSFVDV